MQQIEHFLLDIDGRWSLPLAAPVTLRVLGSTALLLQTDYARGTKDSDVLETPEITTEVSAALLALGGKGTDLHVRHRMYLEILASAFPFLPATPVWKFVRLKPPLIHFRIEALDVTDVCVAKLARFHRTDCDDIAAMVERGWSTQTSLSCAPAPRPNVGSSMHAARISVPYIPLSSRTTDEAPPT